MGGKEIQETHGHIVFSLCFDLFPQCACYNLKPSYICIRLSAQGF